MDKNSFQGYIELFLSENSKVNLISKKDEQFLWEKHICDSLSISKFFEKYHTPQSLIDIGTGGGFPAVPIAINYPEVEVWALDSIAKKIRAVEFFKSNLNLLNLHPVCSRAESFKERKFPLVVSRAVASLDKLLPYADLLTLNDGYFVAYKSKLLDDELENARKILRSTGFQLIDIIEYTLPLNEPIIRKLAVFQKS